MKKLTKAALKKYKLIIDYWFSIEFNGTQAYLKFYPRVKKDTAATNFSKIQNHPEIQDYIEEKYREAAKFVKTSHEGVLKELTNWVQSDITETISLTPSEIKDLPIELRRLITKFKETKRDIYSSKGDILETIKTIDLHFVSKERAIDMINRHIGFYEIDNKQKATAVNIVTKNEFQKNIIEGILNSED